MTRMGSKRKLLHIHAVLDVTPKEDRRRLVIERDFFLGLLKLQQHESPEELLPDALRLLVNVVQARHGYIELTDPAGAAEARWYASEGLDEAQLQRVRSAISRGIVAEALATGRTLHTASASLDPRFSEFESVRYQQIQAVLCAPIGTRRPIGVVYLEGAEAAGPFDDRAERLVELFARCLTPACERLVSENQVRRSEDVAHLLPFPELIARSHAMMKVLSKLALAAPLDVSILFTGPSGTGKSMLAQAVHANSGSAGAPFVEVNCAALPDNLIENELFGSGPGGHSTAPKMGAKGRVGAAEGGILFLDEIGELSLSAQAKLLQLLHSKQYFRLGDSEARTANVRILAASNTDLNAAVREGRFREDLLYRLRVLEMRIPALRERAADVMPLARHFLQTACSRHGFEGMRFSPSAIAVLNLAEWPGNVRQLAHTVEAGVVNAVVTDAQFIEPHHLFPEEASGTEPLKNTQSLQAQLHQVRARTVSMMLEETDWNISEAARRLDVARSYLYRLIQAHGIRRGN